MSINILSNVGFQFKDFDFIIHQCFVRINYRFVYMERVYSRSDVIATLFAMKLLIGFLNVSDIVDW